MVIRMDVWISITGVKQEGGDSEKIEMVTAGRMEEDGDGYRLTYEETEATGMAGVVTSLHVNEREVLLQHSGASNTLLVLEKGRRHLCSYETGYGSLMMGVYTRSIRTTLHRDGGELDLQYTMDINAGMTSTHDIHIAVRPLLS